MKFEFVPIGHRNWSDFETLMESRGSPHSCWCTAWIDVEKKAQKAEKSEKKAAMKKRVGEGIPVGVLAYADGVAMGWCAVAPTATYRSLSGDKVKENAWSIVCFFMKRNFRGRGLSRVFLDEAIEFARENGATLIEGYPVAKESPSFRFMGFVPSFERAGFRFVKMAGSRRHVMSKDLT